MLGLWHGSCHADGYSEAGKMRRLPVLRLIDRALCTIAETNSSRFHPFVSWISWQNTSPKCHPLSTMAAVQIIQTIPNSSTCLVRPWCPATELDLIQCFLRIGVLVLSFVGSGSLGSQSLLFADEGEGAVPKSCSTSQTTLNPANYFTVRFGCFAPPTTVTLRLL